MDVQRRRPARCCVGARAVCSAVTLARHGLGLPRLAAAARSGSTRTATCGCDSGVLSRNERRLQLSRLQSVDVLQPLVARLAGLAEVRVEVAGAGDSKVRPAVPHAARGQRAAQRGDRPLGRRAARRRGGAGERARRRCRRATSCSRCCCAPRPACCCSRTVVPADRHAACTAGAAGIGFLLVGGIPMFGVFTQFSRYYDFTVAESPDGLRLRHGLLQKTRQTVPPGRVQAVGLRAAVPVAQARLGARAAQHRRRVVRRPRAAATSPTPRTCCSRWRRGRSRSRSSARVLPGVDIMSIPLDPRARALARARVDPVAPARASAGTTRCSSPAAGASPSAGTSCRTRAPSSVRVTQGPWQRSLGLASMHVDSTPGAVKITGHHRDAARRAGIAQEQADRAAAARAGDRSLRWVAQQQPVRRRAASAPTAVARARRAAHPSSAAAVAGIAADLGPAPSAVEPDPGERPEA